MSSVILQHNVQSLSPNINQSSFYKINFRQWKSSFLLIFKEHNLDKERRCWETKNFLQERNQVKVIKINVLNYRQEENGWILHNVDSKTRIFGFRVDKNKRDMQIFVIGTSTNFTQDETANNSKVVKNDSIEQINAVQITRLRTLNVQEPINWRDYRFRC